MNVKLRVVQGRPAGKSLLFRVGEYYLGRGPECHIRFNSDWVSRQHCLLRITPEGAFLRDLGSRNGTLLNGSLVQQERPLADGDQIQIGPVLFDVRVEVTPPSSQPEPAGSASSTTLHPDSSAELLVKKEPSVQETTDHPVRPG
jgi:pSer/pThr/pTyr-binding forkhead associated (FHA) protein